MIRLLPLALLGCHAGEPQDGTAVGNPGNMGFSATDSPSDVDVAQAELEIDQVWLPGCGAEPGETLDVYLTVDLFEPSDHPVEVPAGTWCGVELLVADEGGLRVSGQTTGGTTFDVSMDPGTLALDKELEIDGQLLLFTLSLSVFLNADDIEALGEDVSLDPDDAAAINWAREARESGELWEDVDGDGIALEAEDLRLTALAGGEGKSTTSCATGGGAGGGWLVLLALVGVLRRRLSAAR
ncbi:MAG: hypothetical protein H6739_38630 [Alphaproteobacteria bacterium]|nr:hypothetical protein [Alphaproteobacteria bacterium]